MQKFNALVLLVAVAFVASASAQLGGVITSNPAGGQDVNLVASKHFGDPNANVGGGVFANGNTLKGPVTTGAFLDANKNGHGLTLQHSNVPGFGSTLSETARLNLLQNKDHKFDANAFHSRTNLENGFKFDRVGGGLNYNHAQGHGASLGASRIPQLNMNTVDLAGKANLWTSPNRQTGLDLTGGVSKNFGGPFNGQVNKNVGLGLWGRF